VSVKNNGEGFRRNTVKGKKCACWRKKRRAWRGKQIRRGREPSKRETLGKKEKKMHWKGSGTHTWTAKKILGKFVDLFTGGGEKRKKKKKTKRVARAMKKMCPND